MLLAESISNVPLKPERILLFIPTYNCEKQLPRVLEKITPQVQALISEIIIVDNQSQDQTLAAGSKAAEKLAVKTTIFRNKENYSLGGSIKSAFLYAIANNFDYVITLHGDDQADIRDLLPILEKGIHRNNEIVIGARFHPESQLQGYSLVRRLGNRAMNIACSLVTHKRPIYDLIAGLNCFKVDTLRSNYFLLFPNNLTFDAHLLLHTLDRKAPVYYAPITWREEDQISNAKVVRQALIILKLFAAYLFQGQKILTVNQAGRPIDFAYPSEMVFTNS